MLTSILDKVKQIVGIRSCAVELRDLAEPLRPGGELRATVVLRGGTSETKLDGLRVRLDEELIVYFDPGHGEFTYWSTALTTAISLPGARVAPGGELRVPIVVALPELAPSDAHRRWRLCVDAETNGIRPGTSAIVTVDGPLRADALA